VLKNVTAKPRAFLAQKEDSLNQVTKKKHEHLIRYFDICRDSKDRFYELKVVTFP
jgi:hypothetical protein